MKKIILIVFLISSNLIIAQNNSKLIITESEEYEDEVKADIIQSIYLSELGKAAVVRNHKRGIYIDVFDVNLKKESLKTFETDRRENYLGDLFFNDKLLVFTESSPKNNVKILNCIIFNLATGATQKVEIMKPEIEKHQNLFSNKKGTVFALSPNSNYFTLTNYIIHKGEIYFHINVFDSNTFELIFDNKHKRSENQFYSISDIRIDNEKKIFILGKSFFDEENPIVKSNKLYYYLLEKFSTSNYSVLKIDFSDKFVKSLKTAVFDNSYNLYGFYSEKGFNWLKGVCNISIDLDLLKINNLNFQDLPEKIFTDMFGSNKAEKMNKKELSNFDINHILKDSQNNIFLLAEEFYVTSTAGMGPYNMGGGTNNHYDDIIIVKFNPNGKLDWGSNILKSDFKPSYNAFLKNDELHVILNTGSDLNQLDDGRTKIRKGFFESSALYDFSYTIDGNESIQKIQDNKGKAYYLPNFGYYSSGKFIMLSDSENARKFMSLE